MGIAADAIIKIHPKALIHLGIRLFDIIQY